MVLNLTPSSGNFNPSEAERDLLQRFLAIDPLSDRDGEAAYPWNPCAPDAEAYLTTLEADLDWTDEEMAPYVQSLGDRLSQLWADLTPAPTLVSQLHATVAERFAGVPQQWIAGIVEQAQRVVQANLSLADQLVQCVQDILPGFTEDDLHVIARPLAFTMRDGHADTLEAALRTMRCAAWTELSGVEQARLSLAIARYTIAQLPHSHASDRG